MTEKEFLNWDIRAIYTPELLQKWLEVVMKSRIVHAELVTVNHDILLGFYIGDSMEELEEANPDFWFSKSGLEEEFWAFVGVTAITFPTFDDSLLCETVGAY